MTQPATIVVIPTDLEGEDIRFVTIEPTLKKMQELVGGYVEALPMGEMGCTMLFDEEGLLKGAQLNEAATQIMGQQIVGQAVVVGVEGAEWVSVPPEVQAEMQKVMDLFD